MSLQLSSPIQDKKLISNAEYLVLKANNNLDTNMFYFLYEYDWPTVTGGTKWVASTSSTYKLADGWFENSRDDTVTTSTAIGTAYGGKVYYNINTKELVTQVTRDVEVTGWDDYFTTQTITVPVGSRIVPSGFVDSTYYRFDGFSYSTDNSTWTTSTSIAVPETSTNFYLRIEVSFIITRKYIDNLTVGDLSTKYINIHAQSVDWLASEPTSDEVAAGSSLRHFRGWFPNDQYTDGGDYIASSQGWSGSYLTNTLLENKGSTIYAQYYYEPDMTGVSGVIEIMEYDSTRYWNGSAWKPMYNWDDEDSLMGEMNELYAFPSDQASYFYLWAESGTTDTTAKCARYVVSSGSITGGDSPTLYNKSIYGTPGVLHIYWSNNYWRPAMFLKVVNPDDSTYTDDKNIVTSTYGLRGTDDFEDMYSTWFVTSLPPKIKLSGKKPDGTAYTWTGAYSSATSYKRLFLFHSRDYADYNDTENLSIAGCMMLKNGNYAQTSDNYDFKAHYTDNTCISLRYPCTITTVS